MVIDMHHDRQPVLANRIFALKLRASCSSGIRTVLPPRARALLTLKSVLLFMN